MLYRLGFSKTFGKLQGRTVSLNPILVTQDTFSTEPRWDGEDDCFCSSASNGTFFCIRGISETGKVRYSAVVMLAKRAQVEYSHGSRVLGVSGISRLPRESTVSSDIYCQAT